MKKSNKKIKIFLLFTLLLFSVVVIPLVQAQGNYTDIHVFVGEDCPHCAQLEQYLDSIKNDYNINPIYYEVWNNKENQILFQEMAKDYGIQAQGVPTMFINDEHFVGYSPQMNQDIIKAIESEKVFENESFKKTQENKTNFQENNVTAESVNIPLIGKINTTAISLPVLTIILGFLDGFNPCAFFVLLFLLSMLVYAKNKKRMLIIGLTFVFFSGLIYFLFMSAWLNFFMITKNIALVTTIAGLIALIIAVINIKDFFAFKKGVSLSVSDEHKKSLIAKMRSLLKAESITSMMIGTIALAIAANMYELLCTAGFPMVFTKVLVLNELSTISYYSYLLFYNIVYIIPLLTIVLLFTFTFGAKKLSQSQGEALKLLSGMMMLALGSMLVFAPGLLNNIFAAVATICIALIITGVILLIKKILRKKKRG
ncbi:MAG: thioredoxin fold domain-containing protein [Candidatus Woesearchaeota archaeon]